MPLALRIAVGALAGLLLAFAVPQVATHLQQRSAIQQAENAVSAARLETQRQAEVAAAQERAQREAIAEQGAAREAVARAKADAQLKLEADRRAEALRRERAWEKFYVRSERCKVNTDVECANEFIRARRAFDAKWPGSAP